jgi:hypothetical protein
MADENPRRKGDQLEEHSLPGTNQAGKGAEDCQETSEQPRSRAEESGQQEQLEKHSLPGTNQAGKSSDDER